MKKFFITSVFLILALDSANAQITQDNPICFNATIESFNLINYSITESETWDSVTTSNNNTCLNIVASIKNSTTPKNWVQNEMVSAGYSWVRGNMLGSATGASTPNQLSFALNLDITFFDGTNTYTCNGIYIGQGSYAGNPNWWLFSNNNNKKRNFSCNKNGESQTTDIKYEWGDENQMKNYFTLKFN